MTKTPSLSRFQFFARKNPKSKELKEPFLSPQTGKLHTTGRLERGNMGRRWPVLFLISFLMGCNYYCYDNPAALYKPLGDAFASEPQASTREALNSGIAAPRMLPAQLLLACSNSSAARAPVWEVRVLL